MFRPTTGTLWAVLSQDSLCHLWPKQLCSGIFFQTVEGDLAPVLEVGSSGGKTERKIGSQHSWLQATESQTSICMSRNSLAQETEKLVGELTSSTSGAEITNVFSGQESATSSALLPSGYYCSPTCYPYMVDKVLPGAPGCSSTQAGYIIENSHLSSTIIHPMKWKPFQTLPIQIYIQSLL